MYSNKKKIQRFINGLKKNLRNFLIFPFFFSYAASLVKPKGTTLINSKPLVLC